MHKTLVTNRQTAKMWLIALGLSTIVLLRPALTSGQARTRTISGTVTDRRHEPLKDAVVQVENGVTRGVISYITSNDGRYIFKRLDGDTDYRLWASYRGHQSKTRRVSQLDGDRPKMINFVITLP